MLRLVAAVLVNDLAYEAALEPGESREGGNRRSSGSASRKARSDTKVEKDMMGDLEDKV